MAKQTQPRESAVATKGITRYMVAEGRSIMLPDRTILPEFQLIPDGLWGADHAKQMLSFQRAGFVRAIYADASRMVAGMVGRAGGYRSRGKWDFDPDTLTTDTLEELNIKIIERDPTREPYDTREEALAVLTADYVE